MKHLFIKAALLLGAAAAASCGNMKQIKHQPYPETVRGDVVDNYFGTEVPDPYRWLEDDNSEATAAWVAAENAVTQDYLSQIPFRGAIRERLRAPRASTATGGTTLITTVCRTSR